ncbi:MAG: IPT/TIG domain-containing protein [Archangium sp.]|nr:IPT/TIG domain-containing protein [Archangium sp.]
MHLRLVAIAALLSTTLATPVFAGEKQIKNDTFTGAGGVFSGLSFGEYQGAAVLFEPDASEYPLTIIAVDILVVPYMMQGSGIGAYELDIWDESAGTVAPPVPNDGGLRYSGRVDRQGVQVTTSSTMFNRFTLQQPIVVPSGKVFVKFSQQTQTSLDGTTIAMDMASAPKPGANWFFNGFGGFEPFDLPDGGYFNGLNKNWIIRLVVQVPDVAVTVTAINPNRSLTQDATNVVIQGTNFELGATAFIGTTQLAINNLTGTTIAATVPAGIIPGTYDVSVRNGNGIEGRLTNGYTVLTPDGGMGMGGTGGGGGATGGGGGGGGTGNEALALTAITPTSTYAEDPTSLFLTGAGFKVGASVLIGGTRVDGPVVESGGVISAALTANLLTPGKYDVSVVNLNGEQVTLAQSFTVLAGSKLAPRGCSCTTPDALPLIAFALLAFSRRRRT